MKYEKSHVAVINFGNIAIFMQGSAGSYDSAAAALAASCGGYDGGKTNKFSCSSFGVYNASNPPKQGDTVTLAGGTYEFDYVGNHWKCSVVS